MKGLVVCGLALAITGCGGSTPSGLAGTYAATYSGSWSNSTPNTLSGTNTDSATITVTDTAPGEISLTWQIPPNPASGTIVFAYSGSMGTAKVGSGVGGNCFTGTLNGNQQTNCCDVCTVSFTGNAFTQPNSGHYSGIALGVAYTGTYAGTWSGTRR